MQEIREKNSTGKLPVACGCSLGGLHSAIVFLRRPEFFAGMLSLSGVYDAKIFFDGWSNSTLYDNSPVADVYQIWADMVTDDTRKFPDSGEHHFCVFSSFQVVAMNTNIFTRTKKF